MTSYHPLCGRITGSNNVLPSKRDEITRLEKAVDQFAKQMKKRLRTKYREGYRGWEGAYPSEKLGAEANKGTCEIMKKIHRPPRKECIDVANRMMMLWRRGK